MLGILYGSVASSRIAFIDSWQRARKIRKASLCNIEGKTWPIVATAESNPANGVGVPPDGLYPKWPYTSGYIASPHGTDGLININ